MVWVVQKAVETVMEVAVNALANSKDQRMMGGDAEMFVVAGSQNCVAQIGRQGDSRA